MGNLFSGGEEQVEILGNGKINWRKYKVKVDLNKLSSCPTCGEQIRWAKTKNGKKMPIQYSRQRGGYISHYDVCGI